MEEYKTILKKTDGGLDIFSYYLGKECLKKKFKSPFRSGDNRPSCHLYLNEPPSSKKSARTRHQVSRLSCLSYKNLCLGN